MTYELRIVRLTFSGNGMWQTKSDSLITDGKYSFAEILKFLEQLTESGWELVSSKKAKIPGADIRVLDLYLRHPCL